MKILVLNAGSSSQKSCLYELSADGLPPSPPLPVWEAHIDWTVAAAGGVMNVKANGAVLKVELTDGNRDRAIPLLLDTLVSGETRVLHQLSEIDLVGHRVVHGGADYSEATPVTEDVKAAISRLTVLAPAHNPANLSGIKAIEQALGDVTQMAVFDTAFHSHMPPEAAVYPLPYEWYEKGIRRYGFHGISHQFCAHRAADLLGKPLETLKLVTCHLGNGCSLAAVRNGHSIDTTMGFTPLEGLMMGTRSGSIDPAIPIHLMREYGFDVDRLDTLLNKESGLKGVSGISADLRTVLEGIGRGSERAKLAFDMFIHRLRASIGSMVASLGGLDAIVFTAGIGENSAVVREKACTGFEFLGLQLDGEKNSSFPVDRDIATTDSAVRVLVVRTEEDWAIAQACWQLQSGNLVNLSR
ncbi:MAG: acetate kinase [Synechococcus sp.]